MALMGRRKAAMLLMSLDTATAAQMVRGLDAQTVQELAVELAYLDPAGLQASEVRAEILMQFCDSLENGGTFHLGSFLNEMLNSTVGADRAAQIKAEISVIMTGRAGELSAARPEDSLRRVAVTLRNLGKELRDGLLSAIQKEDGKVGEMVAKLMIVWADIPQVADRPLQEVLTGVGARELALALHRADEVIAEKIRSNISEQAVAAVNEEGSLMLAPSKEDVEAARDAIVRVLREMNEEGELVFAREKYDG